MTRRAKRITGVSVAIAAAAIVIFLGITAAEGGSAVSVPMPSGGQVFGGMCTLLAGELARRLLRKLDDVGEKCDKQGQAFNVFRTEIRTALMDVDGRGGIIQDVRDLQSEMGKLQEHLALRGIVPPPTAYRASIASTPVKAP